MAKVYQLQLPQGMTQGTRSAEYVSLYQKNRYRLWEMALKQAQADLKLDREDYVARRKLAIEMQDTLRQEIRDTYDTIDQLRMKEISRQQGIASRNTSAQNSNAQNNANREDRWNLGTGITQRTSRTVSDGTGTEEEESDILAVPNIEQHERVLSDVVSPEARREMNLNIGKTQMEAWYDEDSSQVIVQGTQGTPGFEPSPQSQASVAIGMADAIAAAVSDRNVSEPERQVLRWTALQNMAEVMSEREGNAGLGSPEDILRMMMVDNKAAERTAAKIHTLAPLKTSSPRTPRSPSTTQSSSRVVPAAGGPTMTGVALEEAVDDGGLRADLEARLVELNEELKAIDMPEYQRRSLVQTAHDQYVRDYGRDWRRRPAQPERSPTPQDRLESYLRTHGADSLRQRLAESEAMAVPASPAPMAPPEVQPEVPLEVPLEVPSEARPNAQDLEAVGAVEAVEGVEAIPAESRWDNIRPNTPDDSAEEPERSPTPTPAQEDKQARIWAVEAGIEIAKDKKKFVQMTNTDMGRLVGQLFAAAKDPSNVTEIEDEVIKAYKGTPEEADALAYLHALRTVNTRAAYAGQK